MNSDGTVEDGSGKGALVHVWYFLPSPFHVPKVGFSICLLLLVLQAPNCLASSSLPCNRFCPFLGPQFGQEWEAHILSVHCCCLMWTHGEKDLESGIPCAVSWAGSMADTPDLGWQGWRTFSRCQHGGAIHPLIWVLDTEERFNPFRVIHLPWVEAVGPWGGENHFSTLGQSPSLTFGPRPDKLWGQP